MYIYNVTIKVDWSIHEAWLRWMQEEEIPAMLDSAYFHDYQMVRLLEVDDEDGPTYAIQYYTHTREDYQKYLQVISSAFSDKARKKWGDRFILFGTLMEVVK
jgi:hypothetical protein